MIKYTLLIFSLSFGLFTFGQNDTTKMIPLQEVVVTSTRIPLQQFSVPYSINSIRRMDLDYFSPRTVPEALMITNGVFVQKTNHGGGSPFIRGLTGNQTLLLVDGIRLNNSVYRYGPNQYLNTIDAYSITRVEVAKGTGSVQYGSDALGGALQVFTGEPLLSKGIPEWHGRILGKIMTGDMEKTGRSELEYGSERFAALIGGTWHDFGDLTGGKTTGKQSPSGYKEVAFNAKSVCAFSDKIRLILSHQFLRQQHVPLYHKVVLENYQLNEFDPQQRMLTYARLKIQGQHNLLSDVKLTASWQQSVEGRRTQKNGSTLQVREEDQVNTLGLTAEISSVAGDRWTADSGIEIYRDHVDSKHTEMNPPGSSSFTQKRGLYPDDSKYGNYSVYTLHHLDLGKWILDGGIRFNSFVINVSDITVGEIQISPEALVFNAAVMYKFNGSHHAYSAFSNGLRAPNIDDTGTLGIVDFRYELPAYDLRPEKSRNYELGYKFSLPQFFGTFAAYHMSLSQLITRVKIEGEFIDGYPVYKKENVEKATIRGFEAETNWAPLKGFEISSGISFTYGQNITKNEPLRRIPPLNGRLAGTWTHRKIFASAELLFAARQDRLSQGDIDDNRIADDGTPGWEVLNLYAGYRLSAVKINAGIQNIFDRDYRLHGSGINGVGRSAWVSFSYSFGN